MKNEKQWVEFEKWHNTAVDFVENAEKSVRGNFEDACNSCAFRNGSRGCVSAACPVFHVWDQIRKANKLLIKTSKKISKEIA